LTDDTLVHLPHVFHSACTKRDYTSTAKKSRCYQAVTGRKLREQLTNSTLVYLRVFLSCLCTTRDYTSAAKISRCYQAARGCKLREQLTDSTLVYLRVFLSRPCTKRDYISTAKVYYKNPFSTCSSLSSPAQPALRQHSAFYYNTLSTRVIVLVSLDQVRKVSIFPPSAHSIIYKLPHSPFCVLTFVRKHSRQT
jgi:hypothetical protein